MTGKGVRKKGPGWKREEEEQTVFSWFPICKAYAFDTAIFGFGGGVEFFPQLLCLAAALP